ncbi:MAG: NAD(P)H-hydrate epimerase [Treponemataceae bacterium]|nr:NAD(P)H-hydrate epimerase [Treponemataceae bacterium]
MKAIFYDSGLVEKKAKENYHIPENIMMENASANLEIVINSLIDESYKDSFSILIACGSGNNGADGIALARRIHSKLDCSILLLGQPKTSEGKIQYEMAKALNLNFVDRETFIKKLSEKKKLIILDCIFGSGFHGKLPEEEKFLIEKMNQAQGIKIACDIPSGMEFKSDITVTMGALKSILFTDRAKEMCGQILIADLGISSIDFEKCSKADLKLIEKSDIRIPVRNKKDCNKGNFGHTGVIAGEKSGAAILAASAALNFGSGLVSLIKSGNSNLEQFKISPELMISQSIPENTSAISLGSGLGNINDDILSLLYDFFEKSKNKACVLDADIFSYENLSQILEKLSSFEEAKIILTPHPKELSRLAEKIGIGSFTCDQICDRQEIAENTVKGKLNRIYLAEQILAKYPKLTLILKSSNTIIGLMENGRQEFYLVADGNPSLAKAGSGDVLAGLCASLLAQGYSAKDAALTACQTHALLSTVGEEENLNGNEFYLTPEKLIENLKYIK